MKKLNTVISSKINRSVVLSQIYRHPLISRAKLADMTELDRSAITQILNFLLTEGLVREVEKGKAGAKGGRRPIHLQVETQARAIIALEVSLSAITGVICNLAGEELHRHAIRIKRGDECLPFMKKVLDELKAKAPADFARAVVVGVSSPGVVDSNRGVVVLNMYHRWKDEPVAEVLAAHTGKPVFVENDANAAAMGEVRLLGTQTPVRSLIYLFVRDSEGSTPLGVGGAVVLDGRLWRGANHFAGESSVTINQSFFEILANLEKDNAGKPPKSGRKRATNLALLTELAQEGDAGSARALELMAHRLGGVLAELALFVDPHAVTVSIHPDENMEGFWNQIRASYESQMRSVGDRRIEMIPPKGRDNSSIEGLLAMALDRIFVRESGQQSVLFD